MFQKAEETFVLSYQASHFVLSLMASEEGLQPYDDSVPFSFLFHLSTTPGQIFGRATSSSFEY